MHGAAVERDERAGERGLPVGLGWCPLVMGECVQGRLLDGRHFLITSPIGLFSWAEFTPDPEAQQLTVAPPGWRKSRLAVERYLSAAGLPVGGRLRVITPLDPGQGFGTSSADIAASVRAAATAWGRGVTPDEIARLAVAIEPTDGSMYPGCVAFAHRVGDLLEPLGSLPAFEALVVCTGDIVDTGEFDRRRRDFRYPERDQQDIEAAWAMVRHANRTGDAALMARAATLSSRINEQLLPKPFFGEMLHFVELGGAEGIMTAHSGTAASLILDPTRAGYDRRLAEAQDFMDGLGAPVWFQVSNRRHYQRSSGGHPGVFGRFSSAAPRARSTRRG